MPIVGKAFAGVFVFRGKWNRGAELLLLAMG